MQKRWRMWSRTVHIENLFISVLRFRSVDWPIDSNNIVFLLQFLFVCLSNPFLGFIVWEEKSLPLNMQKKQERKWKIYLRPKYINFFNKLASIQLWFGQLNVFQIAKCMRLSLCFFCVVVHFENGWMSVFLHECKEFAIENAIIHLFCTGNRFFSRSLIICKGFFSYSRFENFVHIFLWMQSFTIFWILSFCRFPPKVFSFHSL